MRWLMRTAVMFLVIVGVARTGAQTPAPPPPTTDEAIGRGAQKHLEAHEATDLFSGAVLVARGDRVLYRGAAGPANLEFGARNRIDTSFRIAGLSRLFTAVAVLRLQEQGKLKVQDTVGTIAPGWPEAYHPITVHQLLVGQSGVKDVTQMPDFVRTVAVPRDIQELAATILKEPLAAPIGTTARATNSNYHLLAALVERLSGIGFHEFVRREVIDRAGLRQTRHDDPSAVINGRAAGYVMTPQGLRHAAWFHMGNAAGMANLVSTVDDVHAFLDALLGGRVITRALVDQMFSEQIPSQTLQGGAVAPGTGYGINVLDNATTRLLTSGGSINGAVANLHHNRATGMTVIVLSNVAGSSGAFSMFNGLIAITSGRPVHHPQKHTAVTPRAEDLAVIAGTWDLPNAFTLAADGTRRPALLTFRADGQRLFGRPAGGGAEYEWFASGPAEFFARHADLQVRLRPADRDVAEYVNSGRVTEIRRQPR